MMLKAQELVKVATRDSVQARAVLLMAYGLYHLPRSGIDNFSKLYQVQIVDQTHSLFQQQLLSGETRAEMVDIQLEAIGVVWLRYPELLGASQQVLIKIIELLISPDIKDDTKACIIQTLSGFLRLNSQDLPNEIKLGRLTELCHSKCFKLRVASYQLLQVLYEQGLTQTQKVVHLAVMGITIDSNQTIRHLSTKLFKQLCHQKFAHIKSYLQSPVQLV